MPSYWRRLCNTSTRFFSRLSCIQLALVAALLGPALLLPEAAGQRDKPALTFPGAAEVSQLLENEPIVPQSWPAWRERLLSWMADRGSGTDPAFQQARAFMHSQARAGDDLPDPYAKDYFAWYLLGGFYLLSADRHEDPAPMMKSAEAALRRCIALEPNFPQAHRNLAKALAAQYRFDLKANATRPNRALIDEARTELEKARRLDPKLAGLNVAAAELAVAQGNFAEAEQSFRKALQDDPQEVELARALAMTVVANPLNQSRRSAAVQAVADQFPQDGVLACILAVAHQLDGHSRQAFQEIERARRLGTNPDSVLSPEVVRTIEQHGAPGWLERFAWTMAYLAGFYLVVMVLMAGAGLVLASRTRGSKALDLIGDRSDALVSDGQVLRTRHESVLARLYAFALFLGLVLFYGTIPFVVAGLLAVTGMLVYVIFLAPRVPLKIVLIIVVLGGGMAWAVLKSLFSRASSGGFGLQKTAADCPKLYQALAEVAQRVDTEPVDEVYVAPGSSIGVHQEGRGPFGVFGVKKRVLTLGLSTMDLLTVNELKAILAHEYAHFSHKDTFYSRFIYKVHISIEQALNGMSATAGKLNYVNPFYWFLWLYYKAYSLLSAGFSRSREFLADRMASSLYGSDTFANALRKVATDGQLFESTVYQNVEQLLAQDKAFVNMYEAFRTYRNEQLSSTEREELYQKMLDEKASWFASHPTIGERIEVVAGLPMAAAQAEHGTESALSLFEKPEEIEKELTDFLTALMNQVRQFQTAMAAQAE